MRTGFPFSPKIVLTGSPGATRRMKKTNVNNRNSIGTTRMTLVITYARRDPDPAIGETTPSPPHRREGKRKRFPVSATYETVIVKYRKN